MYKYTVEGLAEAEQAEATGDASTPESSPQPSPRSRQPYKYELKGIVVHSGTAFAGHYYSFIKVRYFTGLPIKFLQRLSHRDHSMMVSLFHQCDAALVQAQQLDVPSFALQQVPMYAKVTCLYSLVPQHYWLLCA